MFLNGRLYWEVAKRGFRRYATYRAATFAGVFTNTMFGFMRAYVFLAVVAARPVVGGLDRSQLLTYNWAAQGMIMIVFLWGWQEVALRIRTGDIASDLARPYDFEAYWLATDLGRAAYHAVFRGIPPFVVGCLAFHLSVPTSPVVWATFVATLVGAVCVSFALRFLANLAAFWIVDQRGVQSLFQTAWTLLSGFLVPITFFPSWMERLARVLPFSAMVQVPMEVFVGQRHGMALVRAVGFSAFWAVALLALGRSVLRRAERRLVVQGG